MSFNTCHLVFDIVNVVNVVYVVIANLSYIVISKKHHIRISNEFNTNQTEQIKYKHKRAWVIFVFYNILKIAVCQKAYGAYGLVNALTK